MKKILLISFSLIFITQSPFAQPPDNLNGLKICIDPGHGGTNPANDRRIEPDAGNVFWESEGNFRKALWLKPMLEGRGATVYLTRLTNDYPDDSQEPSLATRVAFANSNNVHYFHSIHSNATGGANTGTNSTLMLIREKRPGGPSSSSGNGLGVPEYADSKTLADLVGPNIRNKNRTTGTSTWLDWTFYGGINGGFSLGVLRGLLMPGELSEGSFHDFYPETRRLLNNDYRKGEAYGIYNGFVEFFKIPYDTLGIICGTQKNGSTPINNIVVRLLPLNKVYNGDAYNNGYFLFDSLAPGSYKVVFETPSYPQDTVNVTLAATGRLAASTQPANKEIGVARNSTITFNFVNPMDTAYVRSVFSMTPSTEGTVSWNAANTQMAFTPKNLLNFKTDYTVTLANLGNTLQPTVFVDNKTVASNVGTKPLTLTFQTITLPPYVALTQPVANDTNFSVSQSIGVRFSETMDTASVRSAFQISPLLSGTFTWMNGSLPNNTLIWKPVSGSFAYGTYYTVTIGAGAKSIYGFAIDANKDSIPGDPFTMSFRTQNQPQSVETNPIQPLVYSMEQNYPNPFNPQTSIDFTIASTGFVTLKVYDIVGREAAILVNGMVAPGKYSAVWDASAFASGIYFYKLSSEKFTDVKRMILIK
ncbi:MAG: Ig-like domain-containing protein [Ignavibacteriales bacterium]|nr:Ig-like domain-containing protein [Ignavibacteriales bacterium]